MYYIPKSGLFNTFNAITVVSNVPSILVLVLVPYFVPDSTSQLLTTGAIFMIYRLGNIIGAYNGPRLASTRCPHFLASGFEFFNAILGILFLVTLQFSPKNLAAYSLLYFLKGVIGGFHNNVRFQWLKVLSHRTEMASKVLVYSGAIVQAAFGVGGCLLLMRSQKDIPFFKSVFVLDVFTSIIALLLFLKIKSEPLPKVANHTSSSLLTQLKQPKLASLAVADIFIAMAVAGTNILILKFGELAFSSENGYSISLILYSSAFIFGSFIINEIGTKRLPLLAQVFLFTFASLGMWILKAPSSIFSFVIFFALYPLLLLGLEKAWFENLEQHLAGEIYARRLIFLSLIWALGEPIYAGVSHDLAVRSLFLFIGGLLLISLRLLKRA